MKTIPINPKKKVLRTVQLAEVLVTEMELTQFQQKYNSKILTKEREF